MINAWEEKFCFEWKVLECMERFLVEDESLVVTISDEEVLVAIKKGDLGTTSQLSLTKFEPIVLLNQVKPWKFAYYAVTYYVAELTSENIHRPNVYRAFC